VSNAERLAALVSAGARLEDPGTTHVSAEAIVEAGAVLKPFTILEGRTIVRTGAVVGPFVRLVDVEVGPGAQVLDHCLLRESVIEAGASVGPFAHLRPQSRVGERAKVGNFVELKKTSLGEGSKAQHLSYLGDATVGPGVNIGRGRSPATTTASRSTRPASRRGRSWAATRRSWRRSPWARARTWPPAARSLRTSRRTHSPSARARQVTKPGWAARRRERAAAESPGPSAKTGEDR